MSKTILVVDDDALYQAAIGDGLRAAGYQITAAANGLEALERIREASPDFILLDLIMPKLDGIRLCRILKRHPQYRSVPVIILTGLGQGLKALDDLPAEASLAKRQAAASVAEILDTLHLLESAQLERRSPAEAARGLAERRIVSELLAERRHVQTLLATLGEGVVELDEEGHVLYINPAALAMLDRAEEEVLGRPGEDLLGAANGPALRQGVQEIREAAEGHTVRLELGHGYKTLGLTVTALRQAEGLPGALLVLRDLTDLTQRARSLQALAAVGQQILGKLELAAVLREIVTRAAELLGAERCALFRIEGLGEACRLRCIQTRGLSGRWAREYHSAPGEDAVGKAVEERRTVYTSDLLRDPALRVSDALRALARAEGIEAALAAPILLPDEPFGALTVYRPAGHRFTPDEAELLTSLAGSAAIAIENARLYAAVRGTSQELEMVSRHKSEFLANMSHELRTPLHSMLLFTDLLLGAPGESAGDLSDQQRHSLQAIRSSGERLLDLINDILDLAKVEAGRMGLELTEVPLRPAVLEAVSPARVQAMQGGVTIDLDLAGAPATVVVDPRKFQQILGNLLSNAVKFTPNGGRITVAAQEVADPPGRALEVAVRDSGIGIAPEDRGRLFREFVQLDNSLAKRHRGTGLGLALSKRLVELHGGQIWAESGGLGHGAIFTFRLPCRSGPMAGAVLVVDDEEEGRAAVREALVARGLEVLEAVTGVEAVAMVERAVPDLVILDLQMPLMHGSEVIRRLRRKPGAGGLPILAVTALGPEDGQSALEEGADAYLTKPLTSAALVEAVERLLPSLAHPAPAAGALARPGAAGRGEPGEVLATP